MRHEDHHRADPDRVSWIFLVAWITDRSGIDRSISTTSGTQGFRLFARGDPASSLARDLDVVDHAQRRCEGPAEGRMVVHDENAQGAVSLVQVGGVLHAGSPPSCRRGPGKLGTSSHRSIGPTQQVQRGDIGIARMGDVRHPPKGT